MSRPNNPYLDRYKRNLEREENRRVRRDNTSSLLRTGATLAAGIGVGIAVHAATPGGLYEAGSTVAKAFKSGAKAVSRPKVRNILAREKDNFFAGRDVKVKSAISEIKTEMSTTYKQEFKRMSGRVAPKTKKAARNIPTDKYSDYDLMKRRERGMQSIESISSRMTKDEKHSVMLKEIDDEIANLPDAQAKQMLEMKQKVEHKLNALNSMSKRDIPKLEHEYLKLVEEYDKSLVDKLFQTVSQNIITATDKTKVADVQMSLQDHFVDEIIREGTKQDMGLIETASEFSKSILSGILGYKKASAKDIQELYKKGEVTLKDETRDFLEKIEQDKGVNLGEFFLDHNLYLQGDRLVDTKPIAEVADGVKGALSEGIIGRILFASDRRHFSKIDKRFPIKMMKPGQEMHILSDMQDQGIVDDRNILQQSLVGIGDSIYTLDDPTTAIKENVEFTTGRFGATSRLLSQMSGIHAPDMEDANILRQKLDIGFRTQPSAFQKAKSTFTKKYDENWMPNKIERILSGRETPTGKDIMEMEEYLKTYAKGFDEDLLNILSKKQNILKSGDDPLRLQSTEDILVTFDKLLNKTNTPKKEWSEVIYLYKENPEELLNRTRMIRRPQHFVPNEIQTGIDLLKKESSKILTSEYGHEKTFKLLDELLEKGSISKKQHLQGRGLVAESFFEQLRMSGTGPMGIKPDRIDKIQTLFGEDGIGFVKKWQDAVKDLSKDTHTFFSQGPVEGYESNYVGDIIAINKIDSNRIKEGDLGYIKDLALGTFTRGRENMSEVQYHDIVGYGITSRLNTLLGDSSLAHLSLSEHSLGSTWDIFKNLGLKRVLPAYAGIQGFRYLNDYSSEVGDFTIRQKYERTKAHTRLGVSKATDALGVTSKIQDLDAVTPGSENLVESLHSVPVVGWAADWTGITSSKDYDEWIDYHIHGYDEVREGRWWPLGSQPWMGEGVSHHVPNSYRRAMSEWQYTDTVYGDKDNYWEHSWFPNHTMLPSVENPLRPFRRLNPYWFEQKHKERRPYPISGDLFDPRNPFGAVGNLTVGRLLKPGIDYGAGASPEFVERREDLYDTDTYIAGTWSGGDLDFQVITPHDNVPSEIFNEFQGEGQLTSRRAIAEENQYAKAKAYMGDTSHGYIEGSSGVSKGSAMSKEALYQSNQSIKAEGYRGRVKGSDISKDHLYQINEALKEEAEAGRINASDMSKHQLAIINQTIKDKAEEAYYVDSGELEDIGYFSDAPFDMGIEERDTYMQDPTSTSYRLRKLGYLSKYVAGSRGFIAGSVMFGNEHSAGEKVLERADEAYAMSSRFWDMDPGGRGMALSEFTRRMMNRPRGRMQRVNTRPNLMPGWMPGEDHYINFQEGDPYSGKVSRGEIRLPGEAYESLHSLNPDEYGRYGAVDRAAILADVAPHSAEADFWLDVARNQDLTEEQEDFLNRALERSDAQSDKYFITPYQFKGSVDKRSEKIEKFVGPGTFRVQGDDETYRLAGIERLDFSGETEESLAQLRLLQETMTPGSEIDLIVESDSDYGDSSTPAVVHHEGSNINRRLLSYGAPEKDEESTIEGYAKHTPAGRTVGKAWETVSHAPIPFVHNKFITAQSPLEHMERNNLYDKEFKNWNKPIDDFVKPAFHSAWAESPIMSGLKLGSSFALLGSLLVNPKFAGTLFKAGAGIGALGSTGVGIRETITGEAWIPKYRLQEREINEYFDKLKYIKHKRLFEQHVDAAKKHEGIDLRETIEEIEELEEKQREEVNRIENIQDSLERDSEGEVKTWVNEQGRLQTELDTSQAYIDHKRKELNQELLEMRQEELFMGLGPYSKRAIEHRDEYKSTLFAVDSDNINYERIYRALPQQDREYFKYFSQETDEKKREQILRLVPDDQARMYRILWGEDEDENTMRDLNSYFSNYKLPEYDWAGWQEGVDLDHSKMKLIENEGMDVNAFGLWKDYTKDEELTPAPTRGSFQGGTPNSMARLKAILESYNIRDFNIDIKPIHGQKSKLNMDLSFDIRDTVREEIQAAFG